jgi:serine/threonine-protein kinase
MAVVYKARQRSLDREVALKIMSERFTEDADFVARFEREARALAALSHPNITTIYDRGRASNLFYFAMEYVEGASLEKLLSDSPRGLPPARVLGIFFQVASALGFSHKRGIIHRDIKPGNIMVGRGDSTKVTDFGLAVFFEEGRSVQAHASAIVGTPRYMAPEQRIGASADHRADIYSFGMTFHEALTGELPGPEGQQLSRRFPELDSRLGWIVDRCVEKDPKDRFQAIMHVQELLAELSMSLQEAKVERGAAALAETVAPPSPPPVERDDPTQAMLKSLLDGLLAPQDSGLEAVGKPPSPELPGEDVMGILKKAKARRTAGGGVGAAFGWPLPPKSPKV